MKRRVTGIAAAALLAVVASGCGGASEPPEGLPEGTGAAGFAAATLHLSNATRYLGRTPYETGATTPKAVRAHLAELRTALRTFDSTFVELERRATRGRAGSNGEVRAGWESLLRLGQQTRRRNQLLLIALADTGTLQAHECDLEANRQASLGHVTAMDAVVRASRAIEADYEVDTSYGRVEPYDGEALLAESTIGVAVRCLDAMSMTAASASGKAGAATVSNRPTKAAKARTAQLKALDRFVREGVPVTAPGQLVDAREALLAYAAAVGEAPSAGATSHTHGTLRTLRDTLTRVRMLLG